jgi:hypothetical protein
MSKEAMKLALEALEAGDYYIDDLEARRPSKDASRYHSSAP